MTTKAMSRRRMLKAGSALGLSVAGAASLAACGETKVVTVEKVVEKEVPVEKIVEKEVPVEKIVEKVVEKEVAVIQQAAPTRVTAVIRFAHDHTSGLRGKHMSWSLEKFAEARPDIAVKFEPQNNMFQDSFGIQLAGGTQAELALLDGGFFHQWADKGAFVQINDTLRKAEGYDAKNHCMWPDQCTINFQNTSPMPFNEGLAGPQFGMPYQAGLNGMYYNFTLFEEAGVPQPTAGKWGIETDFLDAMKKLTDADKGQYGFRSSSAMWAFWAGWMRALSTTGTNTYYNADATKMTIFDDGGHKGHDFVVNAIWKDKISNKLEDSKMLSGEFRDPFSAGKVAVANGGSAGNYVVRIAGRFDWGFGLQPEGPRGESPIHTSEQPHLITNAAEGNGTVEQAVDMLVFFAGPVVQDRAAIDRGFIPVHKDVLNSPTMDAAPPQGHSHLATILTTKDDHSHWQSAHPSWWEWFDGWRKGTDKSFLGEVTPEEGRKALTAASDRILDSQHDQWVKYKDWASGLSS